MRAQIVRTGASPRAAREAGTYGRGPLAFPNAPNQVCNEQVKDCLAAIESILDPQLDQLMDGAMAEHKRGETVPLDSIR